MFGIGFPGTTRSSRCCCPAGFGAAPLRKDFVLAARAARPWPGEKDPSDSAGRARRRTLPPGVPPTGPRPGRDAPTRGRRAPAGVIALVEESCTVCMLCVRECPDWCIEIDSHTETLPRRRRRTAGRGPSAVLDRFAIDFALCMYCGICVEVCPFDALHWSPVAEYAATTPDGLVHERDRLASWEATSRRRRPSTPAASSTTPARAARAGGPDRLSGS